MRPWTTASTAWLNAAAADGDPAASHHALLQALLDAYQDTPVRDLTLLPALTTTPPDQEYRSLADWAQADYRAVLHAVAATWTRRLDTELTTLLDQPASQWQLLLVLGWPPTDDTDQDLAYLASYPEHARIPDPDPGPDSGRPHQTWAVILHVPAFAARHALAHHDSAHLDATPGPHLPPGTQPTPAQVRALLRHARDR